MDGCSSSPSRVGADMEDESRGERGEEQSRAEKMLVVQEERDTVRIIDGCCCPAAACLLEEWQAEE